jgi:lysozyme
VNCRKESVRQGGEKWHSSIATIDIYHQTTIDFDKVKNAGIAAIIHKATEGATLRDNEYRPRKQIAKSEGFLWGAYHFSSGASVTDQVDNFLEHAQPEEDDLIALDFEPSRSGPNITLEAAHRFVEIIRNETGRYPLIYGSSMLREAIGTQPDPILANCPLWYARYRNTPLGIPSQVWKSYTLWQCTDGNNGPEPHTVDGTGRCDRNNFNGSLDELRAEWPLTRKAS